MEPVPEKTAPRPPQVTIAAGLVMVGSVFVVLAAFDKIAGLHTRESREFIEDFIGNGLGKSLGLDFQGAVTLIRVLTMVAAACATAAAILGYAVLQRSRSARLGLTVLAVPLFFAGAVVLQFLPAMIAGAIAMLWFQPARDWVDGKAPRPAPTPPPLVLPPTPTWSAPSTQQPTPPPRSESPDSSEPRPMSGFGDRASLLASLPPPSATPLGAQATRATAPTRPQALRTACVLAWVGSGLAAFTMFAMVVLILSSPNRLLDEVGSSDLTLDDLRGPALYGCVVMILWSLTAIVIAGYAWAGRSWAWTSLLVSALSAAVLCLLGVIGNPVAIVPLAFCALAAGLLLRPEVRAYYR